MKDKRTKEEKEANKSFISCLAKQHVVLCKHKVIIVPPSKNDPKKEKAWTLMVIQGKAYTNCDVVIAWYKNREQARQHARRLRTALTHVL